MERLLEWFLCIDWSYFTACVQCGTIYALLGLTGFACLLSCFNRSKLRAQYDLEEAPCADCLVHFCCPGCALCQEYRELKQFRGFDMGIGMKASWLSILYFVNFLFNNNPLIDFEIFSFFVMVSNIKPHSISPISHIFDMLYFLFPNYLLKKAIGFSLKMRYLF